MYKLSQNHAYETTKSSYVKGWRGKGVMCRYEAWCIVITGYGTGAWGRGLRVGEAGDGRGEVDVSTPEPGVLRTRVCVGTYIVTLAFGPSPISSYFSFFYLLFYYIKLYAPYAQSIFLVYQYFFVLPPYQSLNLHSPCLIWYGFFNHLTTLSVSSVKMHWTRIYHWRPSPNILH